MADEEKVSPSEIMGDSLGNSSSDNLSITTPVASRYLRRFSEDLDPRFVYLPLLVCCFATGLTDGTVYNTYGTFVSMQTGNTVFVALGTVGQNNRPFGWARSYGNQGQMEARRSMRMSRRKREKAKKKNTRKMLHLQLYNPSGNALPNTDGVNLVTSIGSFVIGCVFFSRFHSFIGRGRQRRTVFISFLVQTIFVTLAAGIIQGGLIDGRYPSQQAPSYVDFKALIPIALLSFQAAGQIVNSRGLGVSEVPTVVITTLLCDLVSDSNIFVPFSQNPKRNKRACAFVLTLAGAIIGGLISKRTGYVQNSLWLVAALKFSITIFWLVCGKEKKSG
ncbi:DUF1275 domain protein [Xylaria intraflava]|nr:DUF1275 domain protein [Xylaria intraflava]